MTQNQTQIKNQLAQLKAKIARARQRLHTLWDERDCTDYDVLTVSVALDELINEYNRLSGKLGE
ncbi:MAG: aspartyl-phosphate phosphatase Spo0E family protein [Firmicutes bacterium]|nr:aspartyl-phosphate phosphatase Spo0E family protein [Bacillota bacterium]